MFGAARAKQRSEIFGALAAMVQAGVGIAAAIAAIAEDTRDPPLRLALQQMTRETGRGRTLSAAMAAHPRVFAPLTLAMIEVGERGGRLEAALRGLAEYYEREHELRHLLTRELTYPIILFGAIILIPLIGNVLRVWVTDGLAAALGAGVAQLLGYAIFLGIPAAAVTFVVRRMAASAQGRVRLHRLLLGIPVVGPALRKLALARFCRALASLYASGVLLGAAVRLSADATGNDYLRERLSAAAGHIDTGGSLADALERSGVLPATVLSMIRTGERTGDLDILAHNVAAHLELEARTAISQLAVALTPAAIIIAGVIVGIMVISFYAGLYAF